MWCKHCRQDVPGVSLPDQAGVRCAQCGRATTVDERPARNAEKISNVAESGIDLGDVRASSPHAPQFDVWKFDQEIRQWQARLGRTMRVDRPRDPAPIASREPQLRIHQSHGAVPRRHKRPVRKSDRSPLAALLVLTMGMMTFLAGGAMIGASLAWQQPDLWNRGLPLAIAGQVGILLALSLQLERLWTTSRYTARKLKEVDAQLQQLGQTGDAQRYLHSSQASGLLNQMAQQPSSHVLLADLKGQLDRLAGNAERQR